MKDENPIRSAEITVSLSKAMRDLGIEDAFIKEVSTREITTITISRTKNCDKLPLFDAELEVYREHPNKWIRFEYDIIRGDNV